MSDCKGIKILLAICPSNRRDEDFLPQLQVFWNLRLSHVSFAEFVFAVPVSSRLDFLSLPLCRVQLPSREVLLSWSSAVFGLRLTEAT